MTDFRSMFGYSDKVVIDEDHSLTAVVTGFYFGGPFNEKVEVSWMHNGTSHTESFPPWRLSPAVVKL
jgi:hypothetical protein